MILPFTKMHGCRNDYVYINCFGKTIHDPAQLAVRLSNRHTGIGGDGIILIGPSRTACARMRIFNADGSEGRMCGNGVRCAAEYLFTHGLARGMCVRIETASGVRRVVRNAPGWLTVDMETPVLRAKDIPVTIQDRSERAVGIQLCANGTMYRATCLSMGNPHCVIRVPDVQKLDLSAVGPGFEKNVCFPEGVNTEFVQVVDEKHLCVRVWERGSGETQACGTGACAAAVACVLDRVCHPGGDISVRMPGGTLVVRCSAGKVYLTGEAITVFEGVVTLSGRV